MSEFIKSVKGIGIYGQFDFSCQFQAGVNVIYGINGAGKTTLLHIIANVINKDFLRFVTLDFKKIYIEFSESEPITVELKKIKKHNHYHIYIYVNGEKINKKAFCPRKPERLFYNEKSAEILDKLPNLSLAYFPAFRTVIDVSWTVLNAENEFLSPNRRQAIRTRRIQQHSKSRQKTEFVRNLFGQFVPELDYPATREIELELNKQIRNAVARVSQADRTYFGNVPTKILEAFADQKNEIDDTKTILSEIEKLSQEYQDYPIQVESMWDKLSASVKSVPNDSERMATVVLNAYKEALENIVKEQKESFAQVEKYLESVNKFLENKLLAISSDSDFRNSPSVIIKPVGDTPISMKMSQVLSSGERQIVTLLYAATIMSQKDIVLIDELEISLNVDWQRKLLPEMVAQMPSKQLIVCTHSSIVGAGYRDKMTELVSTPTKEPDTSFIDVEIDFSEPEEILIL